MFLRTSHSRCFCSSRCASEMDCCTRRAPAVGSDPASVEIRSAWRLEEDEDEWEVGIPCRGALSEDDDEDECAPWTMVASSSNSSCAEGGGRLHYQGKENMYSRFFQIENVK
jgi:hypothetical protein